ncbi:MAG: four helix bundle protein [Anaerolineaceae bacterium]
MDDFNYATYKNLIVWKKSLEFANAIIDLTEKLDSTRKHFRLIEQLEASSTSVPMNIAEGKGRSSQKEFSHFLMIARGSLYETMTLMEIFKMRNWIKEEDYKILDSQAIEIAKMLTTLSRTIVKEQV